jgi:glycosyltransferase involved in cell wall biosynthesis
LRIALVHNWLVTLGGADRVLLALHEEFPQAPVFVAVHDLQGLPDSYRSLDVHATWLQRIPGAAQHHRLLVPLMPLAFSRLVLREYDLVISSSHACSHCVSAPGALHICYCHTPMRYAWDLQDEYLAALPSVARPAARLILAWLRQRDSAAAGRVDHFIANSQHVASRIRRHYGRESTVIYPPVDVDFFTPSGEPEDYHLIVSRLVPYKRVDVAVEAFNRLGRPLVIVGDGPERRRLQGMARAHVLFVGELADAAVRSYYRQCRALVFPGEEDFGLDPVEAQACGRPVIAYGRGGVLESVVPDVTGLFFAEQIPDALATAVQTAEAMRFDSAVIRQHAERFSHQRFHRQMIDFVAHALEHPKPRSLRSRCLLGATQGTSETPVRGTEPSVPSPDLP